MSFPLITRRRYEQDLAAAARRANAAVDVKDDALDEARVAREVQRFQIEQRQQADQARAKLRRELELSERARKALDATCRQLTDVNDAMCRERAAEQRPVVCLVRHRGAAA